MRKEEKRRKDKDFSMSKGSITRFWAKKKSNYKITNVWVSPNLRMEIRKKRSTKNMENKNYAKFQPHGWRASHTAGHSMKEPASSLMSRAARVFLKTKTVIY